jgi:hypothetical protein
MWVAAWVFMANNNNKNDMSQDSQRQRTGGGDAGKVEQPKGAPTAANRDSHVSGKMPPDKTTVGNDELNIDVGDEKTATRPPQPGTAKPIQKT